MGKGRRRRSFSDSSDLEDSSGSSVEDGGDEDGGLQTNNNSEDADNWVLCDRCTKWRRIPASFVAEIREDMPWYCEHNPNKAFASCSVPQELTNEEIDAAADSDGAGESDHDEESLKRRRIPAVWQLLKDNVLAHRKRKMQDEDDIMICHCKPTWRGGDGCGPDCINRMLCIECVPGFCPSEDRCTNQMFSKRMYANLEIRRAGAKGFGLFALEDIKAGQFIIEYIGEVLEEDEYQRRKDYYMSVGQRHYYFMNIGNGEVIDACRKGNISRFINHSCEPNCETQKWLVRGELAIGLFAVRDIPKDTELTFDYNFERYGDKPMRCYCRSTNCRKFIGGMQDNYDVSLLPPVEPDDASHDLPPIMLTDGDMDPNMRMLLEWRVGVKMDKTKEMGMVTRLERLCKSRNVTWTVKHFYGQEPLSSAQQLQLRPQPESVASAPSISAQGSGADKPERQTVAEAATGAAAKPKQQQQQLQVQQQRKAEKAAAGAGAASAGATSKGRASGTSTAKQSEASAGLSKLRPEDGGGSTTPAPAATSGGHSARHGAGSTPNATPEVAQVRGPKALFKQWKIMQQQDPVPTPAVEEKPAATPSSPPSPQSQHSPPSPLSPPSPRSSLSLDNDDDALDEARNAAAEAARHVPLRKRLRRLPPKPPVLAAEGGAERAENDGAHSAAAAVAAGSAAAKRSGADGNGPGTSGASAGPAAQGSSSGGVARKNSLGSGGAPPANGTAGLLYSPPRSTSPPPPSNTRNGGGGGATGGGGNRRLRSEIDRRLEEVVGSNGKLKDPSRQSVIKVLRLFNLCDIGGGHSGRGNNGFGSAAGGRYLNGVGMSRNGDDLGLPGPGPGSTAGGLTARQRARMADLSLLLDVIIKTTSSAAKKELVACGLLTQLHQATARNTGKEYCVILRKVLRAVEGLPLEANDVYAVRSAHGNFADMLRQLSSNADYDVRTKAAALLKKFPLSAVTDQRLLQLMATPPVRFSHGRGGGGGGARHAPYSSAGSGGGGMMLFAMQQQMMQQQMLKQQQMMRMKEAGTGGSGALPPPPPLPMGDVTAGSLDAAGAGTAPTLPRTSSATSLEEESMDVDQAGQNGPTGLPPLGPGRQRIMAVAAATAAAFANRPGLLRPMMPRAGALGMAGALGNGVGAMGMGPGPVGRGGVVMGSMGMGPSPLGLPPRPPSPANMDLYCGYNGIADDVPYNASKRRKFSHPHGQDGDAAAPLPGPPPRPPYSLAGSAHYQHLAYPSHHSLSVAAMRGRGDGVDGGGSDRDHAGVPSSSDLPLPPPRPSHAYNSSSSSLMQNHYPWPGLRAASEERDRGPDLPERLTAEQLFALLKRPMPRPPQLPLLHGHIQPERHVHGQLTDVVVLFALGLYGSFGRPERPPPPPAAAEGKADDAEEGKADKESGCWSPILSPSGPPMSPIVEPAPAATAAAAAASTAVGTASTLELPLPPPPPPPLPGGAAAIATPWDGAQLRPLRTQSTAAGGSTAAGPSPYRPHGSPSPYGGRDGVPGSATHGPGSTTSTPTVSGFGSVPTQAGAAGFPPPSSAPNSATAAAAAGAGGGGAGLPPVVPISSLSDWRLPPPPQTAGGTAGDAAASGMPRVSPHPSPESHQGGGAAAAVVAARGAGGHGSEPENIDEWLRPVSVHHLEMWEEPDTSFEAFVADMVRHRLGKYMQPEHPSRVSVQEATMLRAKVYREVVAKERRAWEERRSAGVFKPIERHKLEANLKEFVRSTIKRMRDREKEKAAGGGGGGPALAGTGPHHSNGTAGQPASRGHAHGSHGGGHTVSPGQHQHQQLHSGQHQSHLHRQSWPSTQGQTPPPQQTSPAPQSADAGTTPPPAQLRFGEPRPSPSPEAFSSAVTALPREPGTSGGAVGSAQRGAEAAERDHLVSSEEVQVQGDLNGSAPEAPAVPAAGATFAGGCGGVAGGSDVAMAEATAA